jgi:hypothetical protein
MSPSKENQEKKEKGKDSRYGEISHCHGRNMNHYRYCHLEGVTRTQPPLGSPRFGFRPTEMETPVRVGQSFGFLARGLGEYFDAFATCLVKVGYSAESLYSRQR